MKKHWTGAFLLALLLGNALASAESLDKLANDFWAWRAKYAPFTGDDVNRMERPGGTRDWSQAGIDKQRKDLAEFETRWKNDPNFYIAQTLTAVVEALTVPGPYDAARSREILTRIENIPSILQQGTENLDKPPAPFATVAIGALENLRPRLREMAAALVRSTTLNEQ